MGRERGGGGGGVRTEYRGSEKMEGGGCEVERRVRRRKDTKLS